MDVFDLVDFDDGGAMVKTEDDPRADDSGGLATPIPPCKLEEEDGEGSDGDNFGDMLFGDEEEGDVESGRTDKESVAGSATTPKVQRRRIPTPWSIAHGRLFKLGRSLIYFSIGSCCVVLRDVC
jgi:hypothetical protein